MTPDEALSKLLAGNRRFVAGIMQNVAPHHVVRDRHRLAQQQHPFAIVLGCSDSRVAPEIVFDEGLGDIFVIRTAGHVVDNVALGSIEYAVEHFDCPLVLVLAHERCGAVTAAVEGGEIPGHIGDVTVPILPAVEATKDVPGDAVEYALRRHASNTATALQIAQPILAPRVTAGELKIVPARYDLDNGLVRVLGDDG
jgi:carbonic anhydrase